MLGTNGVSSGKETALYGLIHFAFFVRNRTHHTWTFIVKHHQNHGFNSIVNFFTSIR